MAKVRSSRSSKSIRTFNPLSPEDADWFCRHLLPELAAFYGITKSGSRKSTSEDLRKTLAGVGKSILRTERVLAEWFEQVPLTTNSRSHKVIPTEAGAALNHFAKDVLTRSEEFMTEIHRLQNGAEIRVATIHSSWMTFGPELESLYRKRIQSGSVIPTFYTGNDYINEIESAVREGLADVGITSYPPKKVMSPLLIQHLIDQEMVLVVPSRSAHLPQTTGPINVGQFIACNPNLKIVIYNRGLNIPANNKVLNYLKACDADFGSNQKLEGANIAAIKDMLQRIPNTITILPRSAVLREEQDGLFVTFSVHPAMKPWPWAVISRIKTSRSSVECFMCGFEDLKLIKQF